MELYRRGTERNHGYDKILVERDEQFAWRATEKKLYTIRYGATVGRQTSRHNYTLKLSLSDFSAMLDQVVDNAFRDAREELAELMAPRISKLHLLMMCANGYPPPEELYEVVDDEDEDL